MFRVGEIAIRAGEVPALSGDIRARVSFWPLINQRDPKLVVELTPWDANTRLDRLLGPDGALYLLHADKIRQAQTTTTNCSIRLFKPQAPNDMKKGYLGAECWIIADPEPVLIAHSLNRIELRRHFSGGVIA
jgi:hypothetical protein